MQGPKEAIPRGPKLPIVRPLFPDLTDLSFSLAKSLGTGVVTNDGPLVRSFEAELSRYLGVETIVFCNGQTALMTMLVAADLQHPEVICPAFTFGTPDAVRWLSAVPVFADIRDDFTLDPVDVERKLSRWTAAILSVDPYGICTDYEALRKIADRHDLLLLSDSAPAFGSRVNGRLTGNLADAHIFSFHATKPFTTMEGGALSSRDHALMDRARDIRNFGLKTGMPGLNGKMMEVCALIGLRQLERFEEAVDRRQTMVRVMQSGLGQISGIKVALEPANQQPVWTYLPVIVEDEFGCGRDELASRLEDEHNIFVRRYYWPPLASGLSNTDRISSRVLALPVYNDMKIEEADRIVGAIGKIKEGIDARGGMGRGQFVNANG